MGDLTGVAVRDEAVLVTRLMQQQARAITKAAQQLQPEAVAEAVKLLHGTAGKAVVAGVGKSGIVAQKVAATFTSTGTPAVALHPGEALHGDLGIVGQGDVALLISNSGQTAELLSLLPHMRDREVPIIAVVGRENSALAAAAVVVLVASVARELDPYDLAPTASTSVALAIGDALAMAVMTARGFTPEQFARNHPAGTLGKRLTLRVSDIMRTGEQLPLVSSEDSWLDVLEAISGGGMGTVCVTADQRRLLGIITDGDLRRFIQRRGSAALSRLQAADIMTTSPVTTSPEQLAYQALEMMNQRQNQIATLPVVDKHGSCVGLLRLHDIIQSGLA